MAEPVQGIGPAQALTELFALVGKMPLSVDSTIVPVVNVGQVAEEVTWGPLAWGQLIMPVSAAPNGNKFEIALPIANQTVGLRALIEEVWVTPSLATYCSLVASPGLPAHTHDGITSWADTRKRGLPQCQFNGKNDTVLIGPLGPLRIYCPANVVTVLPVHWIIGEHPETNVMQGLYGECSVDNCALNLNVRWREGAPR